VCAETSDVGWLPAGVPIAGIAGDQQAALFGQACYAVGSAKNTYGTGCFVLLNTGETPVASGHGLLTTLAWRIAGRTSYALEGSVFIAGAAVQWLRDGLGLVRQAAEPRRWPSRCPTRAACTSSGVRGAGRAVLGPVRARHHRGRHARHHARAPGARHAGSHRLQSRDVLEAMAADAKVRLPALKVDAAPSPTTSSASSRRTCSTPPSCGPR